MPVLGGSSSGTALRVKRGTLTSGDITISSTTYAQLFTGLPDITIPAAAGDVLEISVSSRWFSFTGSVTGILDAVSVVGASVVNYFSGAGSTGYGFMAWSAPAVPMVLGAPVTYVVQSGDISGGNVTVRLMARVDIAGSVKLKAGAAEPLQWTVKNLGVSGVSNTGEPVEPADHGLTSWTYDPVVATSTSLLTSGILYLARIHVLSGTTVTNLAIGISTGGTGLTASQNLAGLYDTNGNLLVSTTDQSSSWTTSGGKVMAVSSTSLTAGYYWVGVLSNGTTPITLYRGAAPALGNVNINSGNRRFVAYSSGLTALPASGVTLTSTTGAVTLWAGLQ